MQIEEIVKEIKRQERIINDAQKTKAELYEQLLETNEKSFDLITVKQASKMLNVSVGLIYQKITSGELKAQRIGSAIRLSRKAVEKRGGA